VRPQSRLITRPTAGEEKKAVAIGTYCNSISWASEISEAPTGRRRWWLSTQIDGSEITVKAGMGSDSDPKRFPCRCPCCSGCRGSGVKPLQHSARQL